METVVVGVLSGLGFALATLLWHLLVHPDVVLSLWREQPISSAEPPQPSDPRVVGWLRWAVGGLVVLSGFLTGAALAFLAATGA